MTLKTATLPARQVQADSRSAAEIELGLGDRAESTYGSRAEQEWPKITLVTAVYNGEQYLEATIQSILNQRYPNLEYIVVDDGSTDRTQHIIGKYQRDLTCWFSQPNRGLFAALNAGRSEERRVGK